MNNSSTYIVPMRLSALDDAKACLQQAEGFVVEHL